MTKSAWDIYKEKNNFISNKKEIQRPTILVDFTKKELAPGIFVYQNVFNNSTKLIEDIEDVFGTSWQNGAIISENENEISKIDSKSRDCSVSVISPPSSISSEKNDDLYHLITQSMIACYKDYLLLFGINYNELVSDSWQILKYGSGQHFDSHADDGFRFPRTVSITAYLNNNYTGGEIEYKNFKIKYKPEPGDVILFPSNYIYNHKVIPVETGMRYAIVNWFRWKTMKVDMLS
jgi:hypothetical protein